MRQILVDHYQLVDHLLLLLVAQDLGASAGRVLVRSLRLTGTTIVLLPLFLDLMFNFAAEAPRASE